MRGVWNDESGGVLCSLLSLAYAFSFGGLIFTGPLQPWLAQGVAASLVTAAVTAAAIALTSRIKGALAGPESSTVAFIAAMTAGMAPMLEGMGEQGFRIALLAITSCALVIGMLLFTVARLHLGRLVRFVPYPVLAGFMASVGWTITIGALRMGADTHIDVEFLMGWHPATLPLLISTIAFGGFLWFASMRLRHPLRSHWLCSRRSF